MVRVTVSISNLKPTIVKLQKLFNFSKQNSDEEKMFRFLEIDSGRVQMLRTARALRSKTLNFWVE